MNFLVSSAPRSPAVSVTRAWEGVEGILRGEGGPTEPPVTGVAIPDLDQQPSCSSGMVLLPFPVLSRLFCLSQA